MQYSMDELVDGSLQLDTGTLNLLFKVNLWQSAPKMFI